MKRIIAGLLAAVMVLALGGCGLTADESVRKEPVRQLECTQPGALPVIVPMEGARAALAWSDYTTEKTTVQVVNVYGDTVRGEVELEGSWELTEQRLAGGRLALRDWESGLWRFLSADLKDEGTWAAADMNGYFSYDGKSYWFLRDHVLRRQEVAGGEAVPVQLSADLRIADITGMDAESGRMTVQVLARLWWTRRAVRCSCCSGRSIRPPSAVRARVCSASTWRSWATPPGTAAAAGSGSPTPVCSWTPAGTCTPWAVPRT